MRFRFIEDRRADYPVTILCDVLAVSPAGYYAWRSRPESQRSAANRKLVDDIKQVHRDTKGRYGSPRIHAELRAQGRGVSRAASGDLCAITVFAPSLHGPGGSAPPVAGTAFPAPRNRLAATFQVFAPNGYRSQTSL